MVSKAGVDGEEGFSRGFKVMRREFDEEEDDEEGDVMEFDGFRMECNLMEIFKKFDGIHGFRKEIERNIMTRNEM